MDTSRNRNRRGRGRGRGPVRPRVNTMTYQQFEVTTPPRMRTDSLVLRETVQFTLDITNTATFNTQAVKVSDILSKAKGIRDSAMVNYSIILHKVIVWTTGEPANKDITGHFLTLKPANTETGIAKPNLQWTKRSNTRSGFVAIGFKTPQYMINPMTKDDEVFYIYSNTKSVIVEVNITTM